MRLNNFGRIVATEWVRSADIRREIECDEWVVMPNHVHGIVRIVADGDAGGFDGVAIADATNAIANVPAGTDDTVTGTTDDATTVDVMDGSDAVTGPTDDAMAVDVMDGSDDDVTGTMDDTTAVDVMDGSDDDVGATGRSPLPGYPHADTGDRVRFPTNRPNPGYPQTDTGNPGRFPTKTDNHIRPTISPRSLSSFVGGFKSAATKQINIHRNARGTPVWQRNYYERIIRDADELFRVRRYIRNNPLKWDCDRLRPM
ncbi:MAG: transposase [Elainellaceae cyanobacterium]